MDSDWEHFVCREEVGFEGCWLAIIFYLPFFFQKDNIIMELEVLMWARE